MVGKVNKELHALFYCGKQRELFGPLERESLFISMEGQEVAEQSGRRWKQRVKLYFIERKKLKAVDTFHRPKSQTSFFFYSVFEQFLFPSLTLIPSPMLIFVSFTLLLYCFYTAAAVDVRKEKERKKTRRDRQTVVYTLPLLLLASKFFQIWFVHTGAVVVVVEWAVALEVISAVVNHSLSHSIVDMCL